VRAGGSGKHHPHPRRKGNQRKKIEDGIGVTLFGPDWCKLVSMKKRGKRTLFDGLGILKQIREGGKRSIEKKNRQVVMEAIRAGCHQRRHASVTKKKGREKRSRNSDENLRVQRR